MVVTSPDVTISDDVSVIPITRSPRMSDVRGSNSGTAIGYALLMSPNKSETRVRDYPHLWCGFTKIILPEQGDDRSN
ncbi:hypothetical protein T265_01738 [Opisthorchis viverrini]|uniref:Uncharacterized protein n=1 Tax=Opisthorchis viverrini TaxID=6198 RepID=A0A075A1J8_OPIVI|nr:hypothetical protein T265_01738 [Opisthorchis viverrini]KER32117.1 hypothetical protein T265_01738 [Opisthorchis viverrini]